VKIKSCLVAIVVLVFLLAGADFGCASDTVSPLEKSMSDTLDLWREGRYDQLYEQLAHRGKTSRETFVKNMRESPTRPACCWQKMENFRILNEKSSEGTVYVTIGLDAGPGAAGSMTREFKLTRQEGVWKMQLADILSIAGGTGKKGSGSKGHSKKTYLYHGSN
jgi:hypothetical protein